MRRQLYKILAASLGLAMIFTLGCSGGDDPPDGGGGGGSSTLSPCTSGTVRIGSQVWQKCNSNAVPSAGNSRCYDDKESNCAIYGKLYDWDAAKSACPSGFHLPTAEEWDILVDYAGGGIVAGGKLKARSGWEAYGQSGNGTDDYGFSALPGGLGYSNGGFSGVGKNGNWWKSATENNASNAYNRNMNHNNANVNRNNNDKTNLYSVRCVQDCKGKPGNWLPIFLKAHPVHPIIGGIGVQTKFEAGNAFARRRMIGGALSKYAFNSLKDISFVSAYIFA